MTPIHRVRAEFMTTVAIVGGGLAFERGFVTEHLLWSDIGVLG